jgi:hypothetical protein
LEILLPNLSVKSFFKSVAIIDENLNTAIIVGMFFQSIVLLISIYYNYLNYWVKSNIHF